MPETKQCQYTFSLLDLLLGLFFHVWTSILHAACIVMFHLLWLAWYKRRCCFATYSHCQERDVKCIHIFGLSDIGCCRHTSLVSNLTSSETCCNRTWWSRRVFFSSACALCFVVAGSQCSESRLPRHLWREATMVYEGFHFMRNMISRAWKENGAMGDARQTLTS